jgi:serine protease Do
MGRAGRPAGGRGRGLSGAARAQGVQLPDFTELVERVGPAVVNIRTLERGRAAAAGSGELDPSLEEFFRRFGIPLPGGRADPRRGPRGGADDEPQQRGVGSGFILSADGYIMTNAHVVDGADELLVTLTDKREFKARIIGADKRTDVALVKIDATGLPFVKVGDSNRLKVGEWVMAIGSPVRPGQQRHGRHRQRQGARHRRLRALHPDRRGHQPRQLRWPADQPARRGGRHQLADLQPLGRLHGHLVRDPDGRGHARVGPAAHQRARDPGPHRRADRPVTKEVAESIGLGKPAGALVQSVEAGGPADKAGVEAGDIIVKVDGKPVEKSGDLPRIIGNSKPGSKTALQVFRRGGLRELSVTVGEFEAERPTRRAQAEPGATPPVAKSALGLTVADLTDAQKKELRVKAGVRVEGVDGPAARAGLREGDVILSLDNTEIADSKQFASVSAGWRRRVRSACWCAAVMRSTTW